MQKEIVNLATKGYEEVQDARLHPVLRRVFAHRGIVSTDCYAHSVAGLLSPDGLTGIDQAADILCSAREGEERILIVGDYDCDGATSTAVSVRGLKMMGFNNVDYYIPNRFQEGYGLSVETVEKAVRLHKPDIIMTVDNGVTSIEGVEKAKSLGVKVVITDHHLPGEVLPQADAIVNPQLCIETFGSKNLAGVGVVFYLLIKLRQVLKTKGLLEAGVPNLAQLLDIVCLGTVADLVPLDKNNRILVAQGLLRIRAKKCCPGIIALLELSQCEPAHICAGDISFKLAPKLNAAGRLADMRVGVEALLTDSYDMAMNKVQELVGLNTERMQIQYDMIEQAVDLVAQEKSKVSGICLFHPEWHQGVIGILASKMKERFYKPAVIFALDDDGVSIKGSARSIEGINIREVFAKISSDNPGVLVKFGGHAMAAGLTLTKKNLALFKKAFYSVLSSMPEGLFTQKLVVDGGLEERELNIATAEVIRDYGIWGMGFPEPVFMNRARITMKKLLKGLHMKMRLDIHGGRSLDAIWFFAPESSHTFCVEGALCVVYYTLQVSSYMGTKRASLHIVDVDVCSEKAHNEQALIS